MTERIWIDPDLRPAPPAADFATLVRWCRERAESGAKLSPAVVLKRASNARHSLVRKVLVRGRIARPALQREARNLALLRRLDLPAPRPLAWGRAHRGLVCAEFLALERICAATDLETWLCARTTAGCERRAEPILAERLGALVAAMHARGFLHRDLFLRNILLVGADPAQGELLLIDCRKGCLAGPWARRGLRGLAYDLACLDLDLRAAMTTSCLQRWREAYFQRRTGLRRKALERALERRARALVRRFFAKRPAAIRGRCARMGIDPGELRRRWSGHRIPVSLNQRSGKGR